MLYRPLGANGAGRFSEIGFGLRRVLGQAGLRRAAGRWGLVPRRHRAGASPCSTPGPAIRGAKRRPRPRPGAEGKGGRQAGRGQQGRHLSGRRRTGRAGTSRRAPSAPAPERSARAHPRPRDPVAVASCTAPAAGELDRRAAGRTGRPEGGRPGFARSGSTASTPVVVDRAIGLPGNRRGDDRLQMCCAPSGARR